MVYDYERKNIFEILSSFYSTLLDLYAEIISVSKCIIYGHQNITFQAFCQILKHFILQQFQIYRKKNVKVVKVLHNSQPVPLLLNSLRLYGTSVTAKKSLGSSPFYPLFQCFPFMVFFNFVVNLGWPFILKSQGNPET